MATTLGPGRWTAGSLSRVFSRAGWIHLRFIMADRARCRTGTVMPKIINGWIRRPSRRRNLPVGEIRQSFTGRAATAVTQTSFTCIIDIGIGVGRLGEPPALAQSRFFPTETRPMFEGGFLFSPAPEAVSAGWAGDSRPASPPPLPPLRMAFDRSEPLPFAEIFFCVL